MVASTTYQGVAANVAEYYDIPLAELHCFPVRIEFLPECHTGLRNLIRANTYASKRAN